MQEFLSTWKTSGEESLCDHSYARDDICCIIVNVMAGGLGGVILGDLTGKIPLGRGNLTLAFVNCPPTLGVSDIKNGRKTRSVSWGFWHVIMYRLGIWCNNFLVSESPGSAPPLLPVVSHWSYVTIRWMWKETNNTVMPRNEKWRKWFSMGTLSKMLESRTC